MTTSEQEMKKTITISWANGITEVLVNVSGTVSAQEAMLTLCALMSELIVKHAPPCSTADDACERVFTHIRELIKAMVLDNNEEVKQ